MIGLLANRQLGRHAAALIALAGIAAGVAAAPPAHQSDDHTQRGLVRSGGSSSGSDSPSSSTPDPSPPPQQESPAPASAPQIAEPRASEPSAAHATAPSAGKGLVRPNTLDRSPHPATVDLRGIAKPRELPTKGVPLLGGAPTVRPAESAGMGPPMNVAVQSGSGQSIGRSLFPRPASAAPTQTPQFDHTKRSLVKPIQSQSNNNGGGFQNDSSGFHHNGRSGNLPFLTHGGRRPTYIRAYSFPSLFGDLPSFTGNWADPALFGYQSSWNYPAIFAWQQVPSWETDLPADWQGRGYFAVDNSGGPGAPGYFYNSPVVVLDPAPIASPVVIAGVGDGSAPASPLSERRRADLRLRSQINPKYDVMPDFTASIDAAVQGEFSTSIYAMRKAAGVNPAAIAGPQTPVAQAIATDPNAAQRVRFALQTFQNPPQRVVSEADAQFMVAALSAALGDRDSAALAARSALAAGDASTSAALLDRAIRGESLDCSGPWTPGTPLQK